MELKLEPNMCRTCLSVEEPLFDVFNQLEMEEKLTICDLLSSIANVQIHLEDCFSKEICQTCLEKANVAYNFKVMCERSEAMLRKIDQTSPTSKFHEYNSQDETKTSFKVETVAGDDPLKDKLLTDSSHLIPFGATADLHLFHLSPSKNLTESEFDHFIDIDIEDEVYKCEICSESFSQQAELDVHSKTHKTNRNHNCRYCGKSFTRLSNLKLHMAKHAEYKSHLCPICGERFQMAKGLRQHLKYHSGVRPHACNQCDKRYFSPHLLREHVRCAHSNNRYSYTCPICDVKLTAKSTLKMHMKAHNGERTHSCDTCGKTYTRRTYLKVHLRTHTAEPPLCRFQCTYAECGQKFISKVTLDVHVRKAHTLERPFVCEQCGKSFLSMPGLKDHRRIHTGEKPEECSACGNRFVNKQSLKKHMRIHTGERPYSCADCGERFLSSSRRSEHVQTKHGDRQHECPICHKSFHLSRTLKGHMRVHSGEKRPPSKALSQALAASLNVSLELKQNVPEPGFEVIV